jgi:peptide chain release factor 2
VGPRFESERWLKKIAKIYFFRYDNADMDEIAKRIARLDSAEARLAEIEKEMSAADFWKNKEKAQKLIKELNNLKEGKKSGPEAKYDKGDAVLTLMAGAGGDDAEDWAAILFKMYSKFAAKYGWPIEILHKHANDRGGIKNITFEIQGKNLPAGGQGAYGTLKREAGVHRLVRISPYSAKKLRHTSFVLLEVLPKFVETGDVKIDEADLKIDFSRSSGPGGQNVNKRETAVRVTHIPTGFMAHVESERSQAQNKERAIELLRSKLYNYEREARQKEREELRGGKKVEAEWGHQIRSYVFHPYKMVKDHRTGMETADVDAVLNGELDEFIKAEQNLEIKN